jgi:hypothetical protein
MMVGLHDVRDVNIEAAVTAVRSLINSAERSAEAIAGQQYESSDYVWIHSISAARDVGTAFTQMMMLTDALGLTQTYAQIGKEYKEALDREQGLSATDTDPDGEVHLLAADPLRRFVASLEGVYGLKSLHVVSKAVVDVLRGTQYAITDRNCFAEPPASEADVHHRVEAVLKCIFPDLRHTPPIPKAVKNFRPDTGLPSMRTLVEYKFIQEKADLDRVADEILADTRGYKSRDWDCFIFLIYETRRLKSEREWNDLLRECGTALNTQAIVICGEAPKPKLKQGPTQAKTSKSKK